MRKQKLEITIESSILTKTYCVLGIYDPNNHIIEYQDKETMIITNTINLEKQTLTRICKDYELYYTFKENEETKNILKMKDLNQSLEIIIKTIKFLKKDHLLEIEYIHKPERIKYKIQY
ncbi:MAG: hypothetical protein PUB18_01610 [bacterium]|nr:hypothetical protein [bacterium]